MKEKSSPIGCFRYGEDLSYCTFALEFLLSLDLQS